jgi:hypothetical protein
VTLGPSNIIQVNSGNNSATETQTVTVSLSSATSGNTALVGLSMDVAVTVAPSGFVLDIDALAASGAAHNSIYRKQVSAGETSWNFTTNFGGQVAWWVLEISGLDPAPLIASGHDDNLAGTSAELFPSSPVTQTDTLVLAAVQGGVTNIPAVTFSGWTNGFTELADVGTTSGGSNQYSVAVAYLFPGLAGGFGTVVTASASAAMSFASASYLGANIQLPLVGHVRRVGGQ